MLEVGKEFSPDHEHQSVVPATVDEGSPGGAAITGQDCSKGRPRWTIHLLPPNYGHVVSCFCLLELADVIAHRCRSCANGANGRGRSVRVFELSPLSNEFIPVLFESDFHDPTAQLTIQPHRRKADPRSGKVACQLVIGHLYRNRLKRLNAVLQIHDLHNGHLGFR